MKPIEQYISFTGNAGCYGEIPLAVLAGATTFTIEVKFSTTSTKKNTSNWTWGTIVGREIGEHWQDDFGLCVNDGKLCFWAEPKVKNSLTKGTGGVFSNAVVNDGAVHRVAVVSSNSAIDLYCDGANVAHANNVNAKINNEQTMLLAYDSDSNSYLQMDLHEVRFWSIARTQAQIFENIDGTEQGLEAWYIPTDSSTLIDGSINGRNATLYGSPNYSYNLSLSFAYDADTERQLDALLQLDFNTERVIENQSFNELQTLRVWLPFDESTTKDLCGNTWTANSATSISSANAISLNALQCEYRPGMNSTSLAMNGGITLGGQSFTIRGWFKLTQSANLTPGCRIFGLFDNKRTADGSIYLKRDSRGNYIQLFVFDSSTAAVAIDFGGRYFYEVDYNYAEGKFRLFLNGALMATLDKSITETNFAKLELGYSYWSSDSAVGTFDEFQIFDGVALHTDDFAPPNEMDYIQSKLDFVGEVNFSFDIDTERKITNNRPILGEFVQFTGQTGCYGELPLATLAGKSVFTIEIKFSTMSTKTANNYWQCGHIIGREVSGNWQNDGGIYINNGELCFWTSPSELSSDGGLGTYLIRSGIKVNDGEVHTVALVSDSVGSIYLYCDGELVDKTDDVHAVITAAYPLLIAYNSDSNSYLQMDLYETRFWSVARSAEQIFAKIKGTEQGLEAWHVVDNGNANIIPDRSGKGRPITIFGGASYNFIYEKDFDFQTNTERHIFNAPLEFVSDNVADISTGLTINDDGTFYQTEQIKCFDVPPMPEVWLEFDVYFNGSQRWRAYNKAYGEGCCGITAQTDGRLLFFANDVEVRSFSGICIANQVQTVCLHMIAGATSGVIEAWVSGVKVYTYTGDVNHGEPFNDLFLQSDGAGTYFSNLRISNKELPRAQYLQLDFNLERRVVNNSLKIEATTDQELQEKIWNSTGGTNPPNFVFTKDHERTTTTYYQTAITKCFDLPPVYELWMDFDVYFDGTNIWRAGDAGANGICGIVASTDRTLNYFANDELVMTSPTICKANEDQPILLHMRAGLEDLPKSEYDLPQGLIEAWVNGAYAGRYLGNVNDGNEFDNIFLQCDGEGTTFFAGWLFSTNRLNPRINAPTIYLCVCRNGEVIKFPLRNYEIIFDLAFAVLYDGKIWYNVLRDPSDQLASDFYIFHDGTVYALSC